MLKGEVQKVTIHSNRRTSKRLAAVSILCALALVATSALAGAGSSRASSARISAHLTKTSLTSSQSGQVKLKYSFSAQSRTFGYLLSFKKGAKWQKVKSSAMWGSFKGSHTITVKKLFARAPVKVGSYRLKLSADGGSKLLRFKVVASVSPAVSVGSPTGGGTPAGGTPTPTGSAPENTSVPTISGTTRQGWTLTISNGSWNNSPASYAYRWRRCDGSGANCADISSAGASTYMLAYADVASTIRVVVTASNSYGSASATSSQTAVISGPPPVNTAAPAISGTTTQGQALAVSTGSWSNSPTSYAYQWRRCDSSGANCSNISSATSSTYVLVYADAGSTIRVVVTASNAYGASSPATSGQTALVTGLRPANTDLPAISGTSTQGETLTTSNGSWDNSPTSYTYQWQRCDDTDLCTDISGATSGTYTPVLADVDSTILVVVAATNAYGTSNPATSDETDIVGGLPPVNTSLPVISGTATQGQTLTAADDTWNNATDFAYQWQRCDSAGLNCSDISGASSFSYTLVYADAGSTIRVVVTASNDYYSTDATSSQYPAAGTVSGLAPASSSLPTISGTAMQGKTLTSSNGSWDNSPTSYAYQWQRCNSVGANCSGISLATSASYILVAADIGSTIRVVVTATNPYGPTSATSSQYPATGTVIGPVPENTSLPTISGTAKEGQTLTASPGTWTNSPTPPYVYQWRRCDASGSNCSNIGANSSSYTLVFADAEFTIRVVVTASNSSGSTAATSDQTTLVSSIKTFSLAAATTTPTAGQADSLTITAKDSSGNTATSYTGAHCLTFWGPASSPGGTAPIYPARSTCSAGQSAVTFSSGVATVSITLYNAASTSLDVADSSNSIAGTTNLTVGSAAVSKLSLAAATTTPNAGAPDNLTITALDAYGNKATSYTGSHSLTFAGASTIINSPFTPNVTNSSGAASNFGTATAINFSSGVASVSGASNGAMTLYKAETANITVAEGGNYASSALAVTVKTVATAIKAGGFHTCALLSYGGVECWGSNNYGQLGNNSTTNSSTPVAVNIKATAISSGQYTTCAIVSGAVWCWGYNNYGQLGNNSITNSSVPVQVSGITNAITITTAGSFSCALTSAGTVYCWGRNNYGQLGINSTTDSHVPVQVHGVNNSGYLTSISAISAGESHVCAVRSTGSVYCWGYNGYGQLGDNSTRTRKTPVQVRSASGSGYLAGATSVSGGRYHTCALLSAHTVYCWGRNSYGQLGNNSTRNRSLPVAVSGISTASTIATGEYHSCASLSDGTARCWGRNNYGQLGNNSTTDSHVPVTVSGITTATQISAGGENNGSDYAHTCVLLSTGAVDCWGYNGYGELGNGTTTNSSIPVVAALQ